MFAARPTLNVIRSLRIARFALQAKNRKADLDSGALKGSVLKLSRMRDTAHLPKRLDRHIRDTPEVDWKCQVEEEIRRAIGIARFGTGNPRRRFPAEFGHG